MKTDILMNGSTVCNTENIFFIVIPSLSTSSSSGSHPFNFKDTFKTGEVLFYIFLSSSSSSPTTAASSDRRFREGKDQSEIDFHPVHMSSST